VQPPTVPPLSPAEIATADAAEGTAEPEIIEEVTAEPTSGAPPVGITGDSEITFRLFSDWGSAFPGQDVAFTVVLTNQRPATGSEANDLRDITITSRLPTNLEVNGANADRGADPDITGNDINYNLSRLQPGESVEIAIDTTIKEGVPAGTILVVQGQLDFTGLEELINSNIVTLLIVEEGQPVTATTGPTSTPDATDTPGPTATPDAVAAVGSSPTTDSAAGIARGEDADEEPTSDPQAPAPTIAAGEAGPDDPAEAPLPATSAGIPMAGIFLLGLTMIVRAVRLHRERERI
jgi:hypothetical protein